MKKTIVLSILLLSTIFCFGQIVNPLHPSVQFKTNGTADAEIVFTIGIDKGWHVYSTNLGNNGPIEAALHVNKKDGVELVGGLIARGKELSQFDQLFGMNVRYFEKSVQFVQKVKFTKPDFSIDSYLEYGACNDETCLPPQSTEFKKSGKSPATDAKAAAQAEKEIEENPTEEKTFSPDSVNNAADSVAASSTDSISSNLKTNLWKPVVGEIQELNGVKKGQNNSLWYLFLMGVVGGFLALMTPCVWPIIPMTVSFFLHGKKTKKQAVRDAVTYGISIIVIFLLLGIVVTVLFNPSQLNKLATSAGFNIFFFLLLVVFALSFFGWFEIRLPSSWSNKVDSKAAKTTGLLSIFLMAFTLVLVSFSCTVPIIGFLLVEAASKGDLLGPATGMFGFALALAIPFSLFAMFPSWLKSVPKSGSWMNAIKVVLGFIELAFSLKFLSVADLAYGWGILDREVFLSLWIIIFGMMGLYLVGMYKFQSDVVGGEIKPMPVPSIMLGMISLAFAIYMIPGLWGAPCKAVSAFAPPIYTQDFNLNKNVIEAKYTDYEKGMAEAKASGKPVFIDFTGFGCVNCRKMEASVWTDPTVGDMLTDDYVLISLYVDDKTPLKQPIEVKENGKTRTLRTIGDKWSYLQSHKFGSNTQPFYVPVDNEGNPLAGSFSYKEDIPEFIKFMEKGLKNYYKK